MKRNGLFKIFIAVFLIICLIPSVGMLFVGEAKPIANEVLAAKPQIIKRDGSFNFSVLNNASDYVSDRFAFRQELITAWAAFNAKVFGSSVEEQVMLGKNGWLFYTETADDCLGIGLSDAQLASAANNLALMNEYLSENGIGFLFAIAPNKGSLYPEMLPSYISFDHSSSNAARLIPMINDTGTAFADLFEAFQDEEVLYYMTDSHWNSKGAALAADIMLAETGRESSCFSADFSEGDAHRGDLYEMLYPSGGFTETGLDYTPGFYYTADGDTNGGNAISISTSCASGEGRLFCWRDSFGISLYPYLAESFERAFFSRSSQYDLMRPVSEGYDQVIIELVERNLEQLVTVPAVFPAPVRDVSADFRSEVFITASFENGKTDASAKLTRIFGSINNDLLDAGSKIYAVCDGVSYEATVLYENDGHTDFSLWIPADAAASELIVCRDGALVSHVLVFPIK